MASPKAVSDKSVIVAPPDFRLFVYADRDDAIYQPGEQAVFHLRLLRNGVPWQGEVGWKISNDGVEPFQNGTAILKKGVAEVSGTLDQPGFLRCDVTCRVGEVELVAAGGIGFAPFKVEPSLPVPADFDAFWEDKRRVLDNIPLDIQLTPVPRLAKGVDVWDLQANCLGRPVCGFLARPVEAVPKSLPAILTVHGAGVYDSDFDMAVRWARDGFLALDINAHGIPNGRGKDYYAHRNETDLSDYRVRGRESKEMLYHVGMFMRVMRGLDVLTARPEWNGRILVCHGGSKGGAQAIAGAGLDPRVTFTFAGVPAMCDHTGMAVDRVSGWPKIVPVGSDGKPDPAVLESARYVDGVNLASRIKGGAFFTVGFSDPTCPPTGVFAAYNQIKGPKGIFLETNMGHEMLQRVWDEARRRILAHAQG